MDLVRDVLDKQIVDRHSDRMGKVDGVVIRLEAGRAPRVVALDVGPVTLARRLSERFAAWLGRRLERLLGAHAGKGSTRLEVGLVRAIDVEVQLDVDADDTGTRSVEHWVRTHVIAHVPGSGVKE